MLRNISLKTFTTAAVSSAAFLCVSVNNAYAASFNSISRIYAFGDSYSDNGAALRITTAAVNSGVPGAFIFPRVDVYDSDGRWTNNPGLTSVEVLAKQENLQLTDYAIGGAKSGNGKIVARSNLRPLRMQKLKVAANSGQNPGFDFLQECWDDPVLVIIIKKLLAKFPQWGIAIVDGVLVDWKD